MMMTTSQQRGKYLNFKIFETGTKFSDAEPRDDHIRPSGLLKFGKIPADYSVTIEKAIEEGFHKDADVILKKCKTLVASRKKIGAFSKLPNITDEKALAIAAYTLDLGTDKYERNVYRKINKTLSERSDNGLRAIQGYLLHLLAAMRSLPPADNKKTLYRGIKGNHINWETHKVGHTLSWPGFTSTTTNLDNAGAFIEKAENPVIFEIRGKYRGYSIKVFSPHFDEEEVLLEPETVFVIKEIKDDEDFAGAKRIVLEVKPSIPIIDKVVRTFNSVNNPTSDLVLPPPTEAEIQAAGAGAGITGGGAQQKNNDKIQQLQNQHFHDQQQKYQQQLPDGWTLQQDIHTGNTYYYNIKTGQRQIERPTVSHHSTPPLPPSSSPQPQRAIQLCSYPFTCHRKDDTRHLDTYKHVCIYESRDCPYLRDASHVKRYIHLVKDPCDDRNCDKLDDPGHRFFFYHKGMYSYMTPCKERALCNCVNGNDHSHLTKEFHTDTNFEFPKRFSFN